jgi:hypothetical protein
MCWEQERAEMVELEYGKKQRTIEPKREGEGSDENSNLKATNIFSKSDHFPAYVCSI